MTRLAILTFALSVALVACGSETPAGGQADDQDGTGTFAPNDMTGAACNAGTSVACTCADGSSGSQLCRGDSSLSACLCDGAGGIQTNTVLGDGLPCDVAAVADQHCWGCHGAQTQFGAQMSLVTWEDFQMGAPSDPSVPVYRKVMERVVHQNMPMPPNPNPRLNMGEVGVLDAWVAAGAIRAQGSCMDQGTAGTGGEPPINMDVINPDLQMDGAEECFEFRANNGTLGQPYDVPTTPDYYHCFQFAAPWSTRAVQGITSKAIIDNTASIHHWILYTAPLVGQNALGSSCTGAHPDGQFVAGWAPGANDVAMPADVGLEIPSQGGYVLEVHYNAPGAGQKDASGLELCVTKNLRPNVAATHSLGADGFNTAGAGDVKGKCTPDGPFPITILSSSPHMHLKGTHMKTIINRLGGPETLIDMPFVFDAQLAYDTPAVINQGETLDTTCSFNGAVRFGTGTTAEMCYNFVLAYPAGALSRPGGFNGNTCID